MGVKDRKRLAESNQVNRRRHTVLAWMLCEYKDDEGRPYTDIEIAEGLGVSLQTIHEDKRVIQREYSHIFKLPSIELGLLELLHAAADRTIQTGDQFENLYDEILQRYGLSDGDPALRKEILNVLNAKLAVPDKILAIAKFMQPQQQPGLPPGSQLINVQGDLHQAGKQQFVTFDRMTKMLEDRNPGVIGSGHREDDLNFVDMDEAAIGEAAGALRDVVDEDKESE